MACGIADRPIVSAEVCRYGPFGIRAEAYADSVDILQGAPGTFDQLTVRWEHVPGLIRALQECEAARRALGPEGEGTL